MIILFDKGKFGRDFQNWRLRMGLSAKDITAKTGVPRYAMFRVEQGQKSSADYLLALAYFADLEPMDYVSEEDAFGGEQLKLRLKVL